MLAHLRQRASTSVAHRARLDAELVRRGLARSREHASALITADRVKIGPVIAVKAATAVGTDQPITVIAAPEGEDYVSRGGHKLAGALAAFRPQGLVVEGKVALDAGASTGGFTDVLLRSGASRVFAVDVGYGQLAWQLRQDERVVVLDRTNIRHLSAESLSALPELVVADLSFISLTVVLSALQQASEPTADLVLMVKPQFEVGKDRIGKGGVVREQALRTEAIRSVVAAAADLGLGVKGLSASLLPGPAGNVEYFVWLQADAPPADTAAVERVVSEGPQ